MYIWTIKRSNLHVFQQMTDIWTGHKWWKNVDTWKTIYDFVCPSSNSIIWIVCVVHNQNGFIFTVWKIIYLQYYITWFIRDASPVLGCSQCTECCNHEPTTPIQLRHYSTTRQDWMPHALLYSRRMFLVTWACTVCSCVWSVVWVK